MRRPGVLGKYIISEELPPSHRGKVLHASRKGRHQLFRLEIIANADRIGSTLQSRAAQVTALRHPNLLRLVEYGEEHGRGVYVLDGTEGHTLDIIMRRTREAGARTTPAMTAVIVADACRALVFLHAKIVEGSALVHGAVHPSRVFVGLDGRVKLIDLGLGRATARPSDTLAGYLAPEQLNVRATCTAAADIFALGVIMWELLVGERLFECASPAEQTELVARGIDRPSTRVENVPADLEAICMAALALDLGARFDNAKALLEALEAWINASGGGRRAVGLDAFAKSIDAGNVADFLTSATFDLDRDEEPQTLDGDDLVFEGAAPSEDPSLDDRVVSPQNRGPGKIRRVLKSTAGLQGRKQLQQEEEEEDEEEEIPVGFHEVERADHTVPDSVPPLPASLRPRQPSGSAALPTPSSMTGDNTAALALPQLSADTLEDDEGEWLESGMFDEVDSFADGLFEISPDLQAKSATPPPTDPDETQLTAIDSLVKGAPTDPDSTELTPIGVLEQGAAQDRGTAKPKAPQPRRLLVPAPGPGADSKTARKPAEPAHRSEPDLDEEPVTIDAATAGFPEDEILRREPSPEAATSAAEAETPPALDEPDDEESPSVDVPADGAESRIPAEARAPGDAGSELGEEDASIESPSILPEVPPESAWPVDTAEVPSPGPGPIPRPPEERSRNSGIGAATDFFGQHGTKLLAGAGVFFVVAIVIAVVIIAVAVVVRGTNSEGPAPEVSAAANGADPSPADTVKREEGVDPAPSDDDAVADDEGSSDVVVMEPEGAGPEETDEDTTDDEEPAVEDETETEPDDSGQPAADSADPKSDEGAQPAPVNPDPVWKRNGQAMIVVTSTPGSTIYLDGTKMGRTPKWLVVKPGSHKVTLSNSTLKRAVSKQVQVGRGQRRTVSHKF